MPRSIISTDVRYENVNQQVKHFHVSFCSMQRIILNSIFCFLDCWQKQRTHRPTFSSIVTTLDNLARQPMTLLQVRNSPDNDAQACMGTLGLGNASSMGLGGSMAGIIDTKERTLFINADHWLECIKMTRYSQHFKEANLVSAQQVCIFHLFLW